MIKVIAFDLVGVLVKEKNIELTDLESKLERLFRPHISDSGYLVEARKFADKDVVIMRTTIDIINKIYEVKDPGLLEKIKIKYPDVKLIIATNHLSRSRNYIGEALGVQNFDRIFISADMHKIKPNKDFYEEVIEKMKCLPNEVLFLDDNKDNIEGAKNCGLNTILVDKNMNIYEEIVKFIELNKNKA